MAGVCAFPMTGIDCGTPYALVVGKVNEAWQITYLALGVFLAAVSGYQLPRMFCHGASVQRLLAATGLAASLTLLGRALDPFGYLGLLPRTVVLFSSSLYNSIVYGAIFGSVYIIAKENEGVFSRLAKPLSITTLVSVGALLAVDNGLALQGLSSSEVRCYLEISSGVVQILAGTYFLVVWLQGCAILRSRMPLEQMSPETVMATPRSSRASFAQAAALSENKGSSPQAAETGLKYLQGVEPRRRHRVSCALLRSMSPFHQMICVSISLITGLGALQMAISLRALNGRSILPWMAWDSYQDSLALGMAPSVADDATYKEIAGWVVLMAMLWTSSKIHSSNSPYATDTPVTYTEDNVKAKTYLSVSRSLLSLPRSTYRAGNVPSIISGQQSVGASFPQFSSTLSQPSDYSTAYLTGTYTNCSSTPSSASYKHLKM